MTKHLLVVDNYDSFVYNLVHLLEPHARISVIRNDQISINSLAKYDKIVLSPGPGIPHEAGMMMDIIDHYHDKKPLLGVCLGHQAIGEYFGAKLQNLPSPLHGIASKILLKDTSAPIFQNFPNNSEIGHYHSWVIDKSTIPDSLKVTATNQNNLIMAIEHIDYDICGLQFHPESILTPLGKILIQNWVNTQ